MGDIVMTKTDFKRMCKGIETNHIFRIAEPNGYTEIIKHGQNHYSVYSIVYNKYCAERNCVTVAESMQELEYLFV